MPRRRRVPGLIALLACGLVATVAGVLALDGIVTGGSIVRDLLGRDYLAVRPGARPSFTPNVQGTAEDRARVAEILAAIEEGVHGQFRGAELVDAMRMLSYKVADVPLPAV